MNAQELNVNTIWCRSITAELVQLGISEAVICPGSRSAALVSAMRECGQIGLHVQTDERSAAFFAMGLARTTRRAVAVCVTSGSAVANLLPALTEAHALGIPVVMLTCDRPRRLRNMGLPQTTKQAELCLPVVAHCLDLPDPSKHDQDIEDICGQIAGLARFLEQGRYCGPIQINIPLDGRQSSVDGTHGWTDVHGSSAKPPIAPRTQLISTATNDVDAIITELALRPNMRGLIVGGPDDCSLDPKLVGLLAELSGFPLVIDAPGSLRSHGIDGSIAEADFMVYQPEFAQARPDLVIRLGSAPVSSSMQQFLQRAGCNVLRIDRRPVASDFLAPAFSQLIAPAEADIRKLGARLARSDEAWRRLWIDGAAVCRSKLRACVDQLRWSELQAVAQALDVGHFDFIHVANSLSIRLVNLLLPARSGGPAVYANRGVSGIDGTLGTFLGESAGQQSMGLAGRGLLVIGDLAMIHDIPALEACTHRSYKGVILVLNNNGAGLFDSLPVRTVPEYTKLIRNPHGVAFGHIAQAFGLGYTCCRSLHELAQVLKFSGNSDQLHIIEAVCDPDGASKELLRLVGLMSRHPSPLQPVHAYDQAPA